MTISRRMRERAQSLADEKGETLWVALPKGSQTRAMVCMTKDEKRNYHQHYTFLAKVRPTNGDKAKAG